MRDCLNNGAGFDRVLMAVAATFLTVSATSALAQADPARNSAAELAIDAAIPRPEPANVPPPTINDFKMDTTASVPDAARTTRPRRSRPRRRRNRPRPSRPMSSPLPSASPKRPRPPRATRLPPLPFRQRRPKSPRPLDACRSHRNAGRRAGQGRQQCARRGSAGRRQAQGNAGRKIAALFRAQGRAGRGRKILWRAGVRAALDAGRRSDRERQGRHRPPEGCRLRWPQRVRLSGAGFRRRGHQSRCACGSRSETDCQHARLCASGAERPDALVAGFGRHPLSRASDRSQRGAREYHDRQGCLHGARQLQPAAEALPGTEGEARRTARPGRGPGDHRSRTARC